MTEFTAPLEAGDSGILTSRMWLGLAEQLAAAVPDIVISGDPVKAIHWAACAEACFWQATGEGDAKSVTDLLRTYQPAHLEGVGE